MLRAAIGVLLVLDVLALWVVGIDVGALIPAEPARKLTGDVLSSLGGGARALLLQIVPR
jgi:hypothetical protein